VVATLDGKELCYDLTVEPIRTASGEIVGVSCAAIDITERKRAEEERVRLLEREQRAHAEARRAVQMRDQVLSTVAHDLRNPLTAIKGYAQLLRTRVQRETPLEQRAAADVAALTRVPEQRDARTGGVGVGELQQLRQLLTGLSHIDDTVNRMNGLINDLLDTAMLQGGQPLDLQRVPTDLVTLTRDAVEAARQSTERHTVEFHAPPGALVGEWDRPRLRRVIDNVLGNAVKYSPQGGIISVTVGREGDGSQGDSAVLEVADSGIGISAGDLPHIFEWFYRGNNSPEDVMGSGIGLAGAHDIVEQHGGTIAVASELGVGTRFTIRLPL
jgi:signal transduction histidine kinase